MDGKEKKKSHSRDSKHSRKHKRKDKKKRNRESVNDDSDREERNRKRSCSDESDSCTDSRKRKDKNMNSRHEDRRERRHRRSSFSSDSDNPSTTHRRKDKKHKDKRREERKRLRSYSSDSEGSGSIKKKVKKRRRRSEERKYRRSYSSDSESDTKQRRDYEVRNNDIKELKQDYKKREKKTEYEYKEIKDEYRSKEVKNENYEMHDSREDPRNEKHSCSSRERKGDKNTISGRNVIQSREDRHSKKDDRSSDDSEDDLLFDWEQHRYELNRLFFTEEDVIRRGTPDYDDFWKFLKKYHGLQKQKKIREMCSGNKKRKEGSGVSDVFQLPLDFDKRYNVNFGANISIDDIQMRLPPRDLEDGQKRLPRKKLVEMKLIILLYLDFMQKQRFERLRKLRETQDNLPIARYRDEIVSTVAANSVVIIAGDTGCGKSTQVPQYLMAAGYNNIACTQPRRIACISLSKRVAFETLNEYGTKVGYQIRFEKKKTEHTKVVFLTEGLLLRQVSNNTSLSLYDVIILDEIHERHLYTDFLLGVMKCLLMQRDDIKVVLMSATINIELFRNYFSGTAPVIQVPGRLYPIKLQYFPIPVVDQASKTGKLNPAPYVRILQLIDGKYSDDERGDLLVFLSGMNEISTVVEAANIYAEQTNKWIILPLHSTLSVSEQEKVFDVPPDGVRKCIVSTNIAETSVTIDGVRFVVDSGKMKEMSYDTQSKMRKLKEFWISQASAEQRKGRAGRTGPGTCFRLYSEQEYAQFQPYSAPEIQRVPLDSLVLQMISMGLPDVRLFPFIEPPAPEHLENAVHTLKAHGAVTESEAMTTVGGLLAQLPMDISLAKMLIMGSLFHKIEPVLSLAAAMSVQSPFTHRAHRDPDCQAFIKGLHSDHGDPFTLLAAYREWLQVKQEGHDNSRRWCRRRGLEEQRFYEITKLRHQFAQLLNDSGLQDVAGRARGHLTSAERAQRSGHLRQLHELKRELHKEGPRKTKVLKMTHGGGHSDDDDARTDIKDVDFRIKNDPKQLRQIFQNSTIKSATDMILVKIILCSGLYPNVAVADEHNNYKPGSEQVFHTFAKPFAILHPDSVFSAMPEVLQVADSDIVEMPGYSLRHPLSTRHQLLAYVSLLETHKPFLMDSVRVPAAQLLLLFAQAINTNADMTVIACDDFIEMKFPDAMAVQNLVFRAVQLRTLWQDLLDTRMLASKTSLEDPDNLVSKANQLERDLSVGLVDFFTSEALHSTRRLLAADVGVLYNGPGQGDCILSNNPFQPDTPCRPNHVRGGVDLTDFLTYNSLFNTDCYVTTISTYDSVCPYCEAELHLTTLDRLAHMTQCLRGLQDTQPPPEDQDGSDDPLKKKFECGVCGKTLWLSLKDIFKHKQKCG